MFQSTKTYGHDLGLSCCFRQSKATHSHCSLLHGYALSFKFVFECDELDDKNWVQDFGGLKALKAGLVEIFDHTLAVAEDDPARAELEALGHMGLARVVVMGAVGCEAFAQLAWQIADGVVNSKQSLLFEESTPGRVRVVSVECSEHGANSAIYINKEQ